MDFEYIRERIRRERKAQGFTQEQMAGFLGISVNSYREIETGKTLLISNRLAEIARIFNKPLETIVFDLSSVENYTDKLLLMEQEYREKLNIAETSFKIKIAEMEGEINVLKANLKTKESIIGVLRERLPEY